jgi:hypothetical protein
VSMRGSLASAAWKTGWFSGGTLTQAIRESLPQNALDLDQAIGERGNAAK